MKRRLVTALLLLAFVLPGQVLAESSQPREWSQTGFQNELAKAKAKKFTGVVLSHDPVCHCVVVRTPGRELTLQDDYAKFMKKYDRAKGLIIGAEVNGTYKTVNYINYLVSISYVEVPSRASIRATSGHA